MKSTIRLPLFVLLASLFVSLVTPLHAEKPKPHGLPSVDLKKNRIIWGATCDGPDGGGLQFGGTDQLAERGQPPTRERVGGEWKEIRDELGHLNGTQKLCDRLKKLAAEQKDLLALLRHDYFEGQPRPGYSHLIAQPVTGGLVQIASEVERQFSNIERYEASQRQRAAILLPVQQDSIPFKNKILLRAQRLDLLDLMFKSQMNIELAAEMLDAEPPGRTLSPIVYEPKTKCYVLFGGDHLDYITNDLWVFNTAERQWQQRHPKLRPLARANHQLTVVGDGAIKMSGGYYYASNTDYVGGQYIDRDDGEMIYNVVDDVWTGEGVTADAPEREYRTGPFWPAYFYQGEMPSPEKSAAFLNQIPVNTWVLTHPPKMPKMNRDWGTAVLDPDHDLILRFSGGHSAHCGSDVLHYHLNTNRWELTQPVEFPLGQTYSNTDYPEGFNLNQRPWVTGHTYQNYGYDTTLKKMLFTGHKFGCFVYDPALGDWQGRFDKPPGMMYDSCFYSLTLCPTPQGSYAWTAQGELFHLDAARMRWDEVKQVDGKLPGSVVDNSTMVFDSARNRLLFARKEYGNDKPYDGLLHVFDIATGKVSQLTPAGATPAAAIPYLCQLRYDSDHDLLLAGATLPPSSGASTLRTPAYDCQQDRWVSLAIAGDDPSGKEGRNVSLGMMYDPKRKLFWAVDTNSEVYVLRLDPKSADLQPLE